MPIPAIPKYYPDAKLQEASPGLRFAMLLPIWTRSADLRSQSNWQLDTKNNQDRKLADMLKLNAKDKDLLHALIARQRGLAMAQTASSVFVVDAQNTAPFTTGLGNEHPLENGFAFLHPYGLPYLAGSGVKGVLRQSAGELAAGLFADDSGWQAEAMSTADGQPIADGMPPENMPDMQWTSSRIDALFGHAAGEGQAEHLRGALTFWDVIPTIQGGCLSTEIMTPHQAHYYQQKRESKSGNSLSPHDSGQPVPIQFLAIPPGSTFTFYVTCDCAYLQRLAPDLLVNDAWKYLLRRAFEHAFDWLGFGGKTAVGYGAMRFDAAAMQAYQALREQQQHEAEQARMSPEERERQAAQQALSSAINTFREKFSKAKQAGPFNPGGAFNAERLAFLEAVDQWTDTQALREAVALLDESLAWGPPSRNKKTMINERMAGLRSRL